MNIKIYKINLHSYPREREREKEEESKTYRNIKKQKEWLVYIKKILYVKWYIVVYMNEISSYFFLLIINCKCFSFCNIFFSFFFIIVIILSLLHLHLHCLTQSYLYKLHYTFTLSLKYILSSVLYMLLLIVKMR